MAIQDDNGQKGTSVADMDTETLLNAIDSGEVTVVGDEEDEEEHGLGGKQDTGTVKKEKTKSEEETFTIVHNGVEHNFDREKVIEFAQKGFDYDTKVGPHRKMIQLLEADAEARYLLNNHFSRKMGLVPPAPQTLVQPQQQTPSAPVQKKVDFSEIKFTPFREYDNEQEWLKDNITRVLNTIEEKRRAEAPQVPQQPAGQPMGFPQQPAGQPMRAPRVHPVVAMLQRHDPEFYSVVLPEIDNYANNLSVPDYKRVSSSTMDFLDFYDQVKAQVLQKRNNPSNNNNDNSNSNDPSKPKPKRFNLKPGGTNPPNKKATKTVNVWDLGKKEFDALVNRMINNG